MKHVFFFRAAGLLAGLFLALTPPAAAQAPAWQSAQAVAAATAAVAGNESTVTATAVDAAGNVYLAGFFTNSVVLGGTTLTSLGRDDVFVAKFSPVSNQIVWAQRAGGTGNDEAYALAVSGTSVYVTGIFESAAAGFGAITLTSAGVYDAFVAKLTDSGTRAGFTWAQRAGGTGQDYGYALAVSGTSVYIAGSFASPTVNFGNTTLAGSLFTNVFVAKLTDAGPTGSFVWAQQAGGTSEDEAFALAASGASVYVAGYFASSTAGFGGINLTNASSSPDAFVAKLTDAGLTGSFTWAQRAGGAGEDEAIALAVSGQSVYVAGYYGSPVAGFGGTSLANAGVGSADVFVAKLSDAGPTSGFSWAQRAGGTGDDLCGALAVSGTSVYVAGVFDSPTAGFGGTVLANINPGARAFDVFVTKLTDAGTTGGFAWAQRGGGPNNEFTQALALSGTSVYVAGGFLGTNAVFGNTTLTNSGPIALLGFLAALTDPTLTATAAGRVLNPAQLFPNPARRTATLRLPTGTPSIPLTLTDALGRAVRRYPAPAGPETALDLSDLPAGLYLLRGAGPAQRLAVE